jgi:hypothetical protein
MTTAFCLVAAMWVEAAVITVLILTEEIQG